MSHITMMKKLNGKTVQCVIGAENKADFEQMGFVDHVSKLTATTVKPKAKVKKA